jgi:hypothetical protein
MSRQQLKDNAMWHSILRLATTLGLAGALVVAFHSVVSAQVYADQYDGSGYGYSDRYDGYGYSYGGPGTSYEGPNRERMLRSTGP